MNRHMSPEFSCIASILDQAETINRHIRCKRCRRFVEIGAKALAREYTATVLANGGTPCPDDKELARTLNKFRYCPTCRGMINGRSPKLTDS